VNAASELWQAFLAEGAGLAETLRRRVRGHELDDEALAYTAAALEGFAVDAALLGMEELARLASTAGRVAADAARHTLDFAVAEPALGEAADRIGDAIFALARPDSSGARFDPQPAIETEARLAALVGADVVAAAVPVVPDREPGTDDTVWVPQVDEDMIDPFIEECQERIEALAQKLIALESSGTDPELVREIFRDLHTLKGSSGFVGLKKMNRLAHAAEDLVGQVRDGKRSADRLVVDVLLGSLDGLRAILDRAIRRAPIDLDIEPMLDRIRRPSAVVEAAADVGTATVAAATAQAASRSATLRVDFAKLDLLMNLVGELVLGKQRVHTNLQGLSALGRELETQRRLARRTAQPGALDAAERRGLLKELADEIGRVERVFEELSADLTDAAGRLDFVSAELRDQVMKLRMLPIGRLFSKYQRTVRELANSLGKKVELVVEGAETELDKILVEQLDDPLLHLVRNSVDHGIELPAARQKAGKAAAGRLLLRAHHRGNQILVHVEDDGAGIDQERVGKKAVERGIVTQEELEAMDERRLLELIFRPGFSTAAAVTDVSGRGVGMDVVKETVSRLKGTVEISSVLGKGTRMTLRLPLTLAIIQVLLVRVEGEVYAVPIDAVARTLSVPRSSIRRVGDRDVLHDRGVEIPLVDLAVALGLDRARRESHETVHVVLVEVAGDVYGLTCDLLLGKQEIVVKSLGELLEQVEGAAGATLLEDRVAIILDVPAVVSMGRDARPLSASPALAAPAETRAEVPTILLAEDSDTVREGMKRLLESAGYRVVEARDGREALEIAATRRFELVSTDVMMPHMDGYELTRRLRAMPEYKDIPIVMVTSKAEKIDRIRGFDVGVDEYIIKPLDKGELVRAVVRFLKPKGEG